MFNVFLFVLESNKKNNNNNDNKKTKPANTTANENQPTKPTNFKSYIKHSHIQLCVAYALKALTIRLLLLSEFILIYG